MMDARPQWSQLILSIIMPHPHAVRNYRKSWALSQSELADLLSITRPALTRLERETETTRLETAIGMLIVFGVDVNEIVPRTFARVEEVVMARAAQLEACLRGKTDKKSLRKRSLLSDMMQRVTGRADRV